MRRGRTAFLFGIAVAMTLLVAAPLLWRSGRGREPNSRGKTITVWLDTMQLVPGQFDLTTDPAIAAIKALGTNAIPTLVYHIKSPSKKPRGVEVYDGLKDKMGDVGHYLPDTDAAHERQWNTTYRRRTGSALALMALGPEDQAGVPRLFDIVSSLAVTNGEDKMSMVAVASSFRFIGSKDQKLIVGLLGGLEDARLEVRLTTLWALRALQPPPAAAFPLLTNIAADPQDRFRGMAIGLLPRFGKDRPEVVGLLTEVLTNQLDGSARVRVIAVEALKQLGTNALSAMPALEEAAEDPDPYVAKASRAAINRIKKLLDPGRGR